MKKNVMYLVGLVLLIAVFAIGTDKINQRNKELANKIEWILNDNFRTKTIKEIAAKQLNDSIKITDLKFNNNEN